MTYPFPVATYREVVRHAVRRSRLAANLQQSDLGSRMKALGYKWHQQTVSAVEAGTRQVTIEELLGLSLSLGVAISDLLRPYGGLQQRPAIELNEGGGLVVLGSVVSASVGDGRSETWTGWDGNNPIWPSDDDITQMAELEFELHRATYEQDQLRNQWVEAMQVHMTDPTEQAERAAQERHERMSDAGMRVLEIVEQIAALRRRASGRNSEGEDK